MRIIFMNECKETSYIIKVDYRLPDSSIVFSGIMLLNSKFIAMIRNLDLVHQRD